MNRVRHVATSDCERCRPKIVAQPVNTVSSLAYVLGGAAMILRSRRRTRDPNARDAPVNSHRGGLDTGSLVGWASVSAGLGSVAYHGPGGTVGRYLHDASLLALLNSLVADNAWPDARGDLPRVVVAGVSISALVAALPRWSPSAQAVIGSMVAIGEAKRLIGNRGAASGATGTPVAPLVLGSGVLAHILGRSGGPLCRPDSRWQAHAYWHVMSALYVVLRSSGADQTS